MKTTANWLLEYCRHELSPDELARRLTMAGLEVESLRSQGNDVIIESEVTSNRSDLLSSIGIAREVSVLTGQPLHLPDPRPGETQPPAEERATVKVEESDLCPRYTARIISGVETAPSPAWLRSRLESIGLRPVNNVVDITNYVLFECGQPLHAFDMDRLAGRTIVVRRAREGETLLTIDGAEQTLSPRMLVIADARRPVAIAGVMGGLDTEISERTTEVLLESAQFESTQVRRTSRALGLASDSSYRFERGVDPKGVEWASRRAAALIQQVAGGKVASGLIDVWPAPDRPHSITLRLARLNRLLGVEVPRGGAVQILRALGFEIARTDTEGAVTVEVPSFRGDVSREVDLIEEVARIYGYERIPDRTRQPARVATASDAERITDEIRSFLPGLGFYEVMTNSFSTVEEASAVSPWTESPALAFRNTVRAHENRLRVSLLPGLLTAKGNNISRGNKRSPLFEIGTVFLPKSDSQLPYEQSCLALLGEDGFLSLKGVLERVFSSAGLAEGTTVSPLEHPFFENGRAAHITIGNRLLAVLGELCSAQAERIDAPAVPSLAEVNLDLMIECANIRPRFRDLPGYPPSSRDIAVVVPEELPWAEIERNVKATGGELLECIRLFDVYHGEQIPPGHKGVAFSTLFRAADRTLTSQEVDGWRDAIVRKLQDQFGARLRTS